MGRALDNAMLNVGCKDIATAGVSDLGFRMEDIITQERDAALGNGGLGRLAACFLDSLATQLGVTVCGTDMEYSSRKSLMATKSRFQITGWISILGNSLVTMLLWTFSSMGM